MAHTPAYKAVYAAIIARLKRDGVKVGTTSFYPRVEVYGLTESEPLDKGNAVRTIAATVESISTASIADAAAMADDNIALLTDTDLPLGDDWRCLGVIPGQLTDMTEQSDTDKIIYRITQQITVWVEQRQ